ncbi:hypothetical protein [Nocardia cerradoensis]|uniref:DUF8175 domain-containing protein n=1 Tax=Nocardia cerradoensis TaxID=85688 RepID=A0A231GTS6_9NOCA|nr:hypothetical protein [Nocardia cerradoensis]NKY43599.1 hypothetical protein [Nocardia cerradoensis]OXR40023.1 hypothetical protein B7C42_07907 [Nocardia cerradoensis]
MHPHPTHHAGLTALIGLLGIATLTGCTTPGDHIAPPVTSSPADTHAAPTHVTATAYQGISLPAAEEGPHTVTGAVATGFAHTPAGAALAAIHATVRMSVAPDDQWATIGQEMLAPGAGRDDWAVARAQMSITTPITGPPPKILGYRITGYTPDRADTAIYTQQPDTSLTCNTATVIWQAGDWKLLLPDGHHPALVTAANALPTDTILLPIR